MMKHIIRIILKLIPSSKVSYNNPSKWRNNNTFFSFSLEKNQSYSSQIVKLLNKVLFHTLNSSKVRFASCNTESLGKILREKRLN